MITEVQPQSARDANGMQVTLLYVNDVDHEVYGIWVEEDGVLRRGVLTSLVLDYRFDRGQGRWLDVSPMSALVQEVEGQQHT